MNSGSGPPPSAPARPSRTAPTLWRENSRRGPLVRLRGLVRRGRERAPGFGFHERDIRRADGTVRGGVFAEICRGDGLADLRFSLGDIGGSDGAAGIGIA